MKWKGREESTNVEDRRGSGGGGTSMRGGVLGGGLGIIVLIVYLLFGGDLGQIINQPQFTDTYNQPTHEQTVEEEELVDFVSVVLADTEKLWNDLLAIENIDYQEPTLVLYSGYVQSACGTSGASTGPFYCPGDNKVYIDLSFFEEMQAKLGISGDFAMAYVIAHEVGHHVQNQVGIMDQIQQLRAKLSEVEYNEISVRLELQADYLAGVWAHYVAELDLLETGDVEEALNAASAIGDDRIQKQTQGYVVPDSFTHGTSAQRVKWFTLGYEEGDLDLWDTFSIPYEDLAKIGYLNDEFWFYSVTQQ